MQNNSVSFGQNKRGGFLTAVKDSVINVGITAAAGATAGAAGGKIASLLPYKPTESALEFQYADMFQKAIHSEEIPQYLQRTQDSTITNLVTQAKNAIKTHNGCAQAKMEADILGMALANATEADFADTAFQTKIKELIERITNLSGDATPVDLSSKESILMKLKTGSETLVEKAKEAGKNFSQWNDDFIEHAKNIKNTEIDNIAIEGAKGLRKSAFLGVGIAVGVIGALVINMVRTTGHGVKSAKKAKGNAEQV